MLQIFNVANMSFSAIWENKDLTKIFYFVVGDSDLVFLSLQVNKGLLFLLQGKQGDVVICSDLFIIMIIVANSQHASTYSPVAFRSVHTGIVPPFLLKIYYAITACMTQGITFRKY